MRLLSQLGIDGVIACFRQQSQTTPLCPAILPFMKSLRLALLVSICATSIHGQQTATPVEGLSRAQLLASIKCIQQTASENHESGLRLWSNASYHLRYSTFRDPNENAPGWRLVYITLANPDGRSGWIYSVYVHRSKPMIEVGEYGTIKLKTGGRMEIDEVWGGLATHEAITVAPEDDPVCASFANSFH